MEGHLLTENLRMRVFSALLILFVQLSAEESSLKHFIKYLIEKQIEDASVMIFSNLKSTCFSIVPYSSLVLTENENYGGIGCFGPC
jgi:hypothetical protein